jgi:signal transduction histidine kinase
MALIAATVVLFGLHAALLAAVGEPLTDRGLAVNGGFALALLLVAGWSLRRLRRDRRRAAASTVLLDLLAEPRNIQDTATEVLHLLTSLGIGDASIVSIVDSDGGPIRPLAATGYPRGWLDSAPPAGTEVVDEAVAWERQRNVHEWLEPVREALGARPWVAQIPLRTDAEPVGLVLIASRRPGPLADPVMREMLANRLGAAFDHAALYEAAYRRERDLEGLDERRREFMASISHEIRTPLTSIQAFAELLRLDQNTMDETARDLVASLGTSVDRLSALVNDLIDLGRTSAIELAVDRRHVDIAPIIRAAETTLRPAVIVRAQELTVDLPEGELHAWVDPRLLEQALLNLLSNANRYTPPGGAIGLTAFPVNGTLVRIVVEDSGPGIPPSERDRIFEPYYRAKDLEHAVPGSGLGLAVAKRLIDACGGRIWAESSEAGGARLSVEIPRSA